VVAIPTTGLFKGSEAADGGVFTYGDARFYGSAGATRLPAPVVGIVPTADGGGYWLVSADGGVFTYGDARFFGSASADSPSSPVVGLAATPDGLGYWPAVRPTPSEMRSTPATS
jgi:hypothetical protein